MMDADSIWESKMSRLQDPTLEKMKPLVELMGELRDGRQERGEPRSHAPGAREGAGRRSPGSVRCSEHRREQQWCPKNSRCRSTSRATTCASPSSCEIRTAWDKWTPWLSCKGAAVAIPTGSCT